MKIGIKIVPEELGWAVAVWFEEKDSYTPEKLFVRFVGHDAHRAAEAFCEWVRETYK